MEKSLLQNFARYVTFSIMGMLGISCYILADTYFIAKALGSTGIAALNLSIPVYSLVQGIGLMLGIGGATRFNLLLAQGKDEAAEKVLALSVKAGLAAALVFLLTALFGSGAIARALGADTATFALTRTYLGTIFSFAPFFLLNNILLAFVRNDSNPNLAMAAMLTGSLANIILDYLFMFPLGMGMFGAAFATGLAPVISLVMLSAHFAANKTRLAALKQKTSWSRLLDLCRLGSSALIVELSSGVVLVVFNLVILGLEGNEGVAAYGIVANLALVAIAVFTGLGQGMQPLASRYHGLKKYGQTARLLRYALLTSLLIAALLLAGAVLYHERIVAIFNTEGSRRIADMAQNGLLIYFSSFFFAGVNIVVILFFSATERAADAFAFSFARGFALVVPMVLLMSRLWGMNGVWAAIVSSEAAVVLMTLSLALWRKRQAKTAQNLKKYADLQE